MRVQQWLKPPSSELDSCVTARAFPGPASRSSGAVLPQWRMKQASCRQRQDDSQQMRIEPVSAWLCMNSCRFICMISRLRGSASGTANLRCKVSPSTRRTLLPYGERWWRHCRCCQRCQALSIALLVPRSSLVPVDEADALQHAGCPQQHMHSEVMTGPLRPI